MALTAEDVASLYQKDLGRAPEAGAVDFWLNQANNGADISAAIGASPEAAAYGSYGSNHPYVDPGLNPSANIADLYQQYLGRAPEAGAVDFWKNQASNGADIAQAIKNSPEAVQHQQGLFNFGKSPGSSVPNYSQVAQQQSQLNQQNAQDQMWMNNPSQYGPGGSQVRTKNSDGTYNLTTTLSPDLQRNYDAQNSLNYGLLQRANGMAGGQQLDYSGAPQAPAYDSGRAPPVSQFDTSGVSAIPTADSNDLAKVRDSVYQQQQQYLDPQFQQAQSDLESKLANQGLMPGSEAYEREMNNFALTKQKAYGDARNSAIQAGGQEQSRLFGLGIQANQAGENNSLNQFNTGLQSHVAGMNDALTGFNTGLQSRQQGISEANTLHNSPYNDLASLRTGSQMQLPTYGGGVGTSIPGVDLLNAANMDFNANLGVQNANAARSSNTTNGLFGLGAAGLQGGVFNGLFSNS